MEQINTNKLSEQLGTTDNVYKHMSNEDLAEEHEVLIQLKQKAEKENNVRAINNIEEELKLVQEALDERQ